MSLQHLSLFNLPKLLKAKKKVLFNTISAKTHCGHQYVHDFYCDAEKPFIASH